MGWKCPIRWCCHRFDIIPCRPVAGHGGSSDSGRAHGPGWYLLLRQAPPIVLDCSMLTSFSATVLTLNVITMVAFAISTQKFGLQLLLQRITQVLTVVMISHMFLNLKASNRRGSKDAESRDVPSGSGTMHPDAHETGASLQTRVSEPKHLSSLVGNLGNDLIPPSILGRWTFDEKVGENCSDRLLFTLHCCIPVVHLLPRTSTTILRRWRRSRRPAFCISTAEFRGFRCATAYTYNKNQHGLVCSELNREFEGKPYFTVFGNQIYPSKISPQPCGIGRQARGLRCIIVAPSTRNL